MSEGDTLHDSPQLRAQRDMAKQNGGEHEIAMTSDKPLGPGESPSVQPSKTVAEGSTVKYVDTNGEVTHVWENDGWKKP
jgi:hypothetical protein